MDHKFKLAIGDWSGDGHGKSETYVISANRSVYDIRKAYKKSCELTGIQFNENRDYTKLNLKWDHPEYGDRRIATGHQDTHISKLAHMILAKYGVHLPECDNDEELIIENTDEFVKILFEFIQICLPELEYEIVEDDLQFLNSYSDNEDELNVQFGYGLFD